MSGRDYQSLLWKISVTIIAFSFVPLAALGLSIFHQFDASYRAKIEDNLKVLVEGRKSAIDMFLDERISQLQTLAYTHTMAQLKDHEYLNGVFTLMQLRSKSFVDIGVIDQEGNHVSYVGPYNLKGINYAREDWFDAAMFRGMYVTDVFLGFRKLPHISIAVMRREADHNWILRATIDADVLDGFMRSAQAGKRGDAFLLNTRHVLQTRPRFGGEVMGKMEFPDLSRFQGTRVTPMTLGGTEAIVGIGWLQNKDWLLVVREDPAEELEPLFKARHLVIWIVMGGVLLIVLGAVFVSRAMLAEVVRADREKSSLNATLAQQAKMAALGKLGAGIAHEVNNPLSVIKEKAGWIRDLLAEEELKGSPNFKEFEDAVTKIEYHVERARKVTHSLLGFARRLEPVEGRVDINRVLTETLTFLENEARYRNIAIRPDLAEDLPQPLSDATQLQQVFLNIVDNAIDAVEKDGEITITSRYNARDREVVVVIADNGPGIPKSTLGRIFDPFFTTKAVGNGTGLGLAICYSIVEKLGGHIEVASEEGQGTTFTISLPAA